ncbi:MAG: ribonuclease HII [Patescibacteria group bacterium]|nr:ribonuclease HII [Patescibacteria group bacterium]
MSKKSHIIGIDEAGRGPLAGSVYVGAVLLPKNHKTLFKKTNAPKKLMDSKKLTPIQREEWFLWIQKNVPYAYASASAKQIDTINISRACNKAAQRAIDKLQTQSKFKVVDQVEVILDGGLKVFVDKRRFTHTSNKRTQSYLKKSLVLVCGFPKADELVPAVSLASVVAKVLRDRYMLRMHKNYPHYAFHEHKGYGTKKHYRAIKKHGPSSIHRLTFLGSLSTIKKRGK